MNATFWGLVLIVALICVVVGVCVGRNDEDSWDFWTAVMAVLVAGTTVLLVAGFLGIIPLR